MIELLLVIIIFQLAWIGYNTNQSGEKMVEIAKAEATQRGKNAAMLDEIINQLRNK